VYHFSRWKKKKQKLARRVNRLLALPEEDRKKAAWHARFSQPEWSYPQAVQHFLSDGPLPVKKRCHGFVASGEQAATRYQNRWNRADTP